MSAQSPIETTSVSERVGGDVVVQTLRALGARTVFGLPGQHALGLFDALRREPELRLIGTRVESNLAFAADGHARAQLERNPDEPVPVTPLIVSTGPGALATLPALQEAQAASVPLLGISSQVPVPGLGGGRHGYMHELPDQQAAFRGVAKFVHTVRAASQIPAALRSAWETAATPPYGPVWVEIPQDVLLEPVAVPDLGSIEVSPAPLRPLPELIDTAADLLAGAYRPVVLAGGGARRAAAGVELRALAETLRAPVLSTFGGKGTFPWEHPLSGQSWLEDRQSTEFLADADVLLVLGSGLGELTSNYHTLRPRGTVIQVEADVGKLGSNHAALGIHADVRLALDELLVRLPQRDADGRAEAAVADLLGAVRGRLDRQDLALERTVLEDVRAALAPGTPSFWDMTILGYWAWSAWRPDGAPLHSAQGAGGLGFGFPAALGAAAVTGGAALAISGDGGAMYGIAELATAVQHQLNVTWLIIDDGGYGILREYMSGAFGQAHATELARPDFVALAESFGVPAVRSAPDSLRADIAAALDSLGPSVVVLPATLQMFEPTHL